MSRAIELRVSARRTDQCEPVVDRLVGELGGGCLADPHDAVAKHTADGTVAAEATQLVDAAQLREERFAAAEHVLVVGGDHHVGNVTRPAVWLQQQLVLSTRETHDRLARQTRRTRG